MRPGTISPSLLIAALDGGGGLSGEDVLVLAHKAVSKAEGRIRRLSEVTPSPEALELAAAHGKDPRHLQVVLDESSELIRAARGVLICLTHHGFVCANAGVDASNVPGEDAVVMLPRDPDGSARRLRAALRERLGSAPAVIITDSFGRAWRQGQCDVTIGAAGVAPSRIGAAAGTPMAVSSARRRSRWPTSWPVPPIWPEPRTVVSRP